MQGFTVFEILNVQFKIPKSTKRNQRTRAIKQNRAASKNKPNKTKIETTKKAHLSSGSSVFLFEIFHNVQILLGFDRVLGRLGSSIGRIEPRRARRTTVGVVVLE